MLKERSTAGLTTDWHRTTRRKGDQWAWFTIAVMLGLCAPLAELQAQANEIISELEIDAITVYPRSAIVTRMGEVDIPAGASTLIIEDLPANLNAARLQLAIADDGVRFGNLQIQENYQGQTTNPRENELRDQLQALQDQRQVTMDEIETAQSVLRLLDSMAGGGDSAPLRANELTTLVSAISDNVARAREQIRNANITLRTQDQEIAQVQFELDQIATTQTVYSRLHINLQTDSAVSTQVSLSYPQSDASWSWLYEARLNTVERDLGLFRQAAVVQATGEDWNDVTLTLSTANPFTNTRTPELNPQFVDFMPPPAVSASPAAEEVMVTGSMMQRDASPTFDRADTIDTRYQIDYVIPGRVDLAADRQQHVLPVDRETIAV